MMNKKYIYKLSLTLLVSLILLTCQDEDQEFGNVNAPSNITLTYQVVGQDASNPFGDGSGFVDFTVSADQAVTYRFNFGDNTDVEVTPSGTIRHRFNLTGVNTYNVTAIASGTGGITTSTAVSVEVFSAFDDQEAKDFLTGGSGSSKVWYLAASEPAHLGVGPTLDLDIVINGEPNQFYYPAFYSASPFEKCSDEISDCLCDDQLTFSQDMNNQLTFQLNNFGQTFFNGAHQLGVLGEEAGEDACYDYDTSGVSNVSLSPTSIDWSLVPDPDFMPRGTVLNFSDGAFMGYYVGSSTYDIITITNDFLYVRTFDALNPDLVWYHKYSTTDPNSISTELETIYTSLVWEDDFNTDGAPNPANWTYDIGTGSGGWGNGESQYYTDASSNVIVENGNLKITARAESFMGSNYTSSRLKSENLYEFTYGRVEIRAKLPTGGGTWPALWMLGADYDTNPWPGCGEMDIMEHVGNNQNTIYGTLHFPGNSGGDAQGGETQNPTASSEFHNYTVEWRDDQILFAVDNVVYFSYPIDANLPFDSDFFLIMNVAMGGTFGGAIDSGFTESTMEVDYVRVYQ